MYFNIISFYICCIILQVYCAPANNVISLRTVREAAPHTPNGQLAFGQASAAALAQTSNINYGYTGGVKGTNQLGGGGYYPAQPQYYRPNNNCCGGGGGGVTGGGGGGGGGRRGGWHHHHQNNGWQNGQNGGGWNNNNPGTGGYYPGVIQGNKGTASGSASGTGQFSQSSANANTQHFNSGGISGSASSSSANSVSSNTGYGGYGGRQGTSAIANAQAK